MYTWSQGRSNKVKSIDRALSCILGVTKRDVFWGLPNIYPESYDCGLPGHLAVMRAVMMEPGVHTMSDELIPQISCNIFLAFKWILMMTSGQNISHYTTAKLSVHVWNHDLIWWQNKIDTQKHFHKTTITSSWTLSKTKIPITIVKAQMPSNPNQKSRMRDNNGNNKANLKDIIAATGLVILNEIQIDIQIDFSARVTLTFDRWHRKTIGHLF